MIRSLIVLIVMMLQLSVSNGQKTVASSIIIKSDTEMLKIPSGSFQSFYEKKETGNLIAINAFYLDKYAVTNQQFLEFVKANPNWSRSKISKLFADTSYLKHWQGDLTIGDQGIYNSPVINVSWFAASAYSKWVGKRLPTTAEWEYAAFQEIANKSKGDTTKVIDVILSWYSKPTRKVVPNVGTTFQNIFGVNDLHGLIWEWTADFNSYVAGGDSRSSDEIERNLFCASGSFGTVNKEDYAAYMRYGFRGSLKGTYCIQNLGFRCAKEIISIKKKNQ